MIEDDSGLEFCKIRSLSAITLQLSFFYFSLYSFPELLLDIF